MHVPLAIGVDVGGVHAHEGLRRRHAPEERVVLVDDRRSVDPEPGWRIEIDEEKVDASRRGDVAGREIEAVCPRDRGT